MIAPVGSLGPVPPLLLLLHQNPVFDHHLVTPRFFAAVVVAVGIQTLAPATILIVYAFTVGLEWARTGDWR